MLDIRGRIDRQPANVWITRSETREVAPVRLLCLPYAGGGASVYRSWPALLPDVDVVAVQLPGREERINEPAVAQIEVIVAELADALVIEDELDRPFALFGHSMGARIAFELARELRRRGARAPGLLFASACKAPHIPRVPTPPISTMPDRLFVSMLRGMNGTPPEVLDNPEFMRTVLPTLRADFAVIDSYDYVDESALPVPIRAFGGTGDGDAREDDLMAWQAHTTESFRLRMLPGGHFIVNTAAKAMTHAIGEELSVLADGRPA